MEVAFAGRSNAGKSSAINVLVDHNNLCKTSKTPGRTQMINYFRLSSEGNEDKYLVDLPGYGYAKVPLDVKEHWQQLLSTYLAERASLKGVVIIMDVRRPMTEFDTVMMDWCLAVNMPAHVLLTKEDKLKKGAAKNAFLAMRAECAKNYPNCSVQLFSSLKKTGVAELVLVLNQWFDMLTEPEELV